MRKKFITFILLLISAFSFAACGNAKVDLNKHLIEKRTTLFTAQDDVYSVSLSGGLREENYALDGHVNNLVNFAVLTLARNDSNPLANDTYTYAVTINETQHTGDLIKNPTNNTYSTDLEIEIPQDATINVKIRCTGYTFNQDLENTSQHFTVDSQKAIEMANKELAENVKNLTSNKNNKIEVVMKLLKDHSDSELKTYYWYVGVISTNGETLGVLLNANTGETIAKKV